MSQKKICQHRDVHYASYTDGYIKTCVSCSALLENTMPTEEAPEYRKYRACYKALFGVAPPRIGGVSDVEHYRGWLRYKRTFGISPAVAVEDGQLTFEEERSRATAVKLVNVLAKTKRAIDLEIE